MKWPETVVSRLRQEAHYDGRKVLCFKDRPANLDRMFRAACDARGDEEALVAGVERITYRELVGRVGRVAGNLAALGISRGERVAFSLSNRPEFLYLLLACFRLGAVALPLNVRMRRPEYEYVLTHSGARLIVHETAITQHIPDDLPGLEWRFACGAEMPDERLFDELLAEPPMPAPDMEAGEDEPAAILYTSGTTGQPKGAVLTHFGIIQSVQNFEACWGLQKGERSLLAVPASHVTGLVAILLATIGVGGCTVMMGEFKAHAFLGLAEAERCSYTLMVPAMYNLCLLDPEFPEFDLSGWRVGGYGGAPMPETTIERMAEKLPNLTLVNAYGATETTSPATLMPPGLTAERRDSVGCVVPGGRIRIIGEDGQEAAPGEAGEIWIAGPMVVPGYWNNDAANEAGFTDGFWKSGDIGSLDEAGFLRVFDRKKDMINRAGFKVYSAEVENVLSHHPAVKEVAIIGRPDPVLGERVHAFIVPKGEAPEESELEAFCSVRLSDYKVPESFTYLEDALPRNPNGKVLKAALRELLAEEA